MPNPRQANGHRRRQLRARVLREEDDCWRCGQPVDKTLPPHLDGSPEVDEVIPIGLGGDPLDRNNVRLAHRLCNVRAGQQTKQAIKARRMLPVFTTSRIW